MAVADQQITDRYAIYQGDCIEVMQDLKTSFATCQFIPLHLVAFITTRHRKETCQTARTTTSFLNIIVS